VNAPPPNATEIDNWNNATGKTWAMLHERLDRQIAPIGREAMRRAGFKAGDQVLDVGCGCGETSLDISGQIAPGEVTGLDPSAPLLEIAREAARGQGIGNIRFTEGDAQVHALPAGHFDVLFSRFGVMFFEDPTAAFANLRKGLKPGARLAFCCWRSPAENDWLSIPLRAASHLLPPLPPSDPTAPGPFAFADRDRVSRILSGAGFTQVQIEPFDLIMGTDTLEQAVVQALRMGPLGAALRQAGASDELKHKVEAALRDALEPRVVDGKVRLPAAAWIVSARNP
jgi:SAM-dependent methyltransferase